MIIFTSMMRRSRVALTVSSPFCHPRDFRAFVDRDASCRFVRDDARAMRVRGVRSRCSFASLCYVRVFTKICIFRVA
jgi:hypothetical protein